VTVNTVSAGYIDTDMMRGVKPEVLEKILSTVAGAALQAVGPDGGYARVPAK
jgi:NAD(P)-dependent dehydrogenase (short-subunit alcohol dehydrogenase family)